MISIASSSHSSLFFIVVAAIFLNLAFVSASPTTNRAYRRIRPDEDFRIRSDEEIPDFDPSFDNAAEQKAVSIFKQISIQSNLIIKLDPNEK